METTVKLDALAEQIAVQEGKLPPLDKWNPEFSGDLDMRIARDGSWYYLGSEITRPALVRLFSTILWREGDEHFLMTPVEKYRIRVDCEPFIAQTVTVEPDSERGDLLVFTLNTGDQVLVDKDHPLWVEIGETQQEPIPRLRVRRNLNALISRNAFYDLVKLAEAQSEGQTEWRVTSAGESFLIGTV